MPDKKHHNAITKTQWVSDPSLQEIRQKCVFTHCHVPGTQHRALHIVGAQIPYPGDFFSIMGVQGVHTRCQVQRGCDVEVRLEGRKGGGESWKGQPVSVCLVAGRGARVGDEAGGGTD